MTKEMTEELLVQYVEKGLRIRIALDEAIEALEDIERNAEDYGEYTAHWALVNIRKILAGADDTEGMDVNGLY